VAARLNSCDDRRGHGVRVRLSAPPSCVFGESTANHGALEKTRGERSLFLTPTTNAIGRLPNTAGAAEDRAPALAASTLLAVVDGLAARGTARLQARAASQISPSADVLMATLRSALHWVRLTSHILLSFLWCFCYGFLCLLLFGVGTICFLPLRLPSLVS
jgi:hypothetical protein